MPAHIVEVLRFCDSGVLKGAADELRCSWSRKFLEKYLRSASKTLFPRQTDRWGIVPVSTERPSEGSNLENMVL